MSVLLTRGAKRMPGSNAAQPWAEFQLVPTYSPNRQVLTSVRLRIKQTWLCHWSGPWTSTEAQNFMHRVKKQIKDVWDRPIKVKPVSGAVRLPGGKRHLDVPVKFEIAATGAKQVQNPVRANWHYYAFFTKLAPNAPDVRSAVNHGKGELRFDNRDVDLNVTARNRHTKPSLRKSACTEGHTPLHGGLPTRQAGRLAPVSSGFYAMYLGGTRRICKVNSRTTISHEFGHAIGYLPDEYNPADVPDGGWGNRNPTLGVVNPANPFSDFDGVMNLGTQVRERNFAPVFDTLNGTGRHRTDGLLLPDCEFSW